MFVGLAIERPAQSTSSMHSGHLVVQPLRGVTSLRDHFFKSHFRRIRSHLGAGGRL